MQTLKEFRVLVPKYKIRNFVFGSK